MCPTVIWKCKNMYLYTHSSMEAINNSFMICGYEVLFYVLSIIEQTGFQSSTISFNFILNQIKVIACNGTVVITVWTRN